MKTTAHVTFAVIITAGLAAMWAPAQGYAAVPGSHPPLAKSGRTTAAGISLPDAAYVASVVGVTPAVLNRDLAAGETVVQIAGSRFRTADALATALLTPLKTKLDRAVSSGVMPASKAATAYAQMHSAYAVLVVTPHPPLSAAQTVGHKTRGSGGRGQSDDAIYAAMAAQCRTSVAALKAALAAGGRTPLAICQSTNAQVTQDALVATLVGVMERGLGHAPTADEHAAIQEKITRWLTTPAGASSGTGKR